MSIVVFVPMTQGRLTPAASSLRAGGAAANTNAAAAGVGNGDSDNQSEGTTTQVEIAELGEERMIMLVGRGYDGEPQEGSARHRGLATSTATSDTDADVVASMRTTTEEKSAIAPAAAVTTVNNIDSSTGISTTTETTENNISTTPTTTPATAASPTTSRVVVKYGTPKGRVDAMALSTHVYHDFQEEGVLALELDDASIAYLQSRDSQDDILSIEGDHVWKAQGRFEGYYDPDEEDDVDEDPLAQDGQQEGSNEDNEQKRRRLKETVPYGISMVQADAIEMGRKPVTVCVADTGIAPNHPDLKDATVKGTSSSDSNNYKWSGDTNGHGTHIAGTIAAVANNGIGVAGIGNVPLHITRALGNDGEASESDIMEAFKLCVKSGARVISMSLGGPSMTDAFRQYVDDIYHNKGILVVGAMGNDGTNTRAYPGALSSVIAVAAVNKSRNRWYDSNWGTWNELSAPGERVLSTSVKNGGSQFTYSVYSGTSMAVPHVSGVAAKVWSHHPKCTNYQIRYVLGLTADQLGGGSGSSSCNGMYGHGLIQAKAALDFLNEYPCDGTGKFTDWDGGTVDAYRGGCGTVSGDAKVLYKRAERKRQNRKDKKTSRNKKKDDKRRNEGNGRQRRRRRKRNRREKDM